MSRRAQNETVHDHAGQPELLDPATPPEPPFTLFAVPSMSPPRPRVEEDFLTVLEELSRPQRCDDWGNKVQLLCEQFWRFLAEETVIAALVIGSFTSLLQQEDAFAIAQLVIPAFRDASTVTPENDNKQHILRYIELGRSISLQIQEQDQAHFDAYQPLYYQEKQIFHEAEVERARRLLYNHDILNAQQKEAVRQWMAARPCKTNTTEAPHSGRDTVQSGDRARRIPGLDTVGRGGPQEEDLAEADIYRAGLLVYHSGSLSASQKEALREWMIARPGNAVVEEGAVDQASASAVEWLPPDTIRSWESLDLILNTRGAVLEGDIFTVLAPLPYVVRSFEFAVADGALDCDHGFPPHATYADRFWAVDQEQLPTIPKNLLLFDVKSTNCQLAGDQYYITTIRQRREVAFYIGICVVDPSFVELIPNLYQGRPGSTARSQPDGDEVAVNTSRVSHLPPSAYVLDPCNAPYRMPLALLPRAIERVRSCVQRGQPYVNPWTQVSFPQWRPTTTSASDALKPSEESQHFTAYRAAMEVYRIMNKVSLRSPLLLDFVGLQPRLADFKFIPAWVQGPKDLESPGPQHQRFVQHKLDGRDRTSSTSLAKVAISRAQGGNRWWYFQAHDRFDYLFYQFDYATGPKQRPLTMFFFLPERVLPDEFYATEELEGDFTRDAFHDYRVEMDEGGLWVQRILDIIAQHPEPRQVAPRPSRVIHDQESPQHPTTLPSTPSQTGDRPSQGRRDHARMMARGHRQLFSALMEQCAQRMSGLVLLLASNHPMGDFGFCRYTWTFQEQRQFFRTGRPPKLIHQLPSHTPIILMYYYTRHLECTSDGPNLTAPQFRRLNSCAHSRLVIWNLWGPDDHRLRPLLIVPTTDISPTTAQQDLYARNLLIDKSKGFTERTPPTFAVLNTGLSMTDYVVGNQGPMIYDHSDADDWIAGEVWALLHRFTGLETLQHPKPRQRDPASYRYPLWEVHRRLVEDEVSEL